MLAVLSGVIVISTCGWLVSLSLPHSAVRRHLVLMTTLVACLLLPAALAVRRYTNWTSVAIPVAATSVTIGEARAAVVGALLEPANDMEAREPSNDASPQVVSTIDAEGAPLNGPATREPQAIAIADKPAPVDGARRTDWWEVALIALSCVYLSVAFPFTVRLLARLVAAWRVKGRAIPIEIPPGEFLPEGVQLLEADVAVPVAIGFGQWAIVLPRGFREAVEPAVVADVIRHELAHLQRRDHWVLLLQGLAGAVYWPVVTVHLANRALSRAREELCDNAAISGRSALDYGRTLLVVAERLAVAERLGGRIEVGNRIRPLGSPIIGRGELERRVAGLLDERRDRRGHASRCVRWASAITILLLVVLGSSARLVAMAEQVPEEKAASTDAADEGSKDTTLAANQNISWTGIPKVSLDEPTLHRGVVLGSDGKPVAGASIYAGSTIVLFEMAKDDNVSKRKLGPARAITDEQGRFEFQTTDLSWLAPDGKRKRWETILIATKDGLAPGWLSTWGEDRGFREHSHPRQDREVAIRMQRAAVLTGRLLLVGGEPLAGAQVRLTALMAPRGYDLETHIQKEEMKTPGMFSGTNYASAVYRPQVLPGLNTTVTADAEGRFEMPGLPEGYIAQLEITHPMAVTTTLRAAVRAIEPVYRKRYETAKPELSLYGSGFTAELPPGVVLRGEVASGGISSSRPAPGVIVALANQNSPDGMDGQQFTTDAEGRFEMTGLPNRPQGFQLAFVGSFAAPVASNRKLILPGEDTRVKLTPAVRYRLKLTDASGQPINRSVYSIYVQRTPGEFRRDVKWHFNEPVRVAPGVYEGIVPVGAAAVVVKRGAETDRPVAVDPKAFFAPDRSDWTLEEERFAFGNEWAIAVPGISTHDELAASNNRMESQLDLTAVVFTNTNSSDEDEILELAATIETDPPVAFELVDEAGNPVEGAAVTRQLVRYNGKDLPATFPVNGLHPTRAEFLQFTEPKRDLIGIVRTTWTKDKVRVVMRPAAYLKGRFVKKSGQPDLNFGARVLGEGIPPDTFLAGLALPEPRGTFEIMLPPGLEVRGEFVRKFPDWKTRPPVGVAFGPLTPEAGAKIDLGDVQVP